MVSRASNHWWLDLGLFWKLEFSSENYTGFSSIVKEYHSVLLRGIILKISSVTERKIEFALHHKTNYICVTFVCCSAARWKN